MFKALLLSSFLLLFCKPLFADNGRVVHIAWSESHTGAIHSKTNHQIGLHFFEQRNQFLIYKDPNNPLFKIRFTWLFIDWTILHFIALFLTILIQVLTFRKINRHMVESKFFKRWSLRFLKMVLWAAVLTGNAGAILVIDYYNTQIHFRYHQLSDFKGVNTEALKVSRSDITYFQAQETNKLRFQIYRKEKGKWYTQRALPVLHFKRKTDGQIYFLYDKRYYKTHPDSTRLKATTQLIVLHDKNQLGKDTSFFFRFENKTMVPFEPKVDKAKRILVFVNGYRPVSNDQNPEKALQAINNKGLEHPRSKNLIYDSDLFQYWQQEKFCSLVQQRIQPDLTLFADGHHSVNTSNHQSLIKFMSSATLYPKPCIGMHHCATTQIANNQKVRTYSLLSTAPNYNGFRIRFNAGQQAGRNLLQELAKNGNLTQNDTLYAISHSMGHAYFMGMASVLKGKIQFGAYHAFAPENPKGKFFKEKLWRAVFQYGTKLYGPKRHAPCQQDGVAPQWRMSGLSEDQQICFPKSLAKRLGFFSSHFIGYYDWVFEIPKGQPGYIGVL